MKVSNPDAVTVLQTEATKSNNERLSAIAKAFAGDGDLMAKAIADPNVTVESIKASLYDGLKAENAKLKEEKAKAQPATVGFAPSDKPSANAEPATQGEAFEAEATALWNKDESLRAEFGGIFSDFRADFKHNRKDYVK